MIGTWVGTIMGLLQHTSVTILSRWSGFVLDGLTSIVVARDIGPAGKGTLAVLGVIAGLAMQMGNFGLHAATAHFVPLTARRRLPYSVACALVGCLT